MNVREALLLQIATEVCRVTGYKTATSAALHREIDHALFLASNSKTMREHIAKPSLPPFPAQEGTE